MANQVVKTRIQLKNDIEANWNKALNFIPLKGELIIYSSDDAHPFSRFKVGDGTTPVVDLPFSGAQSSDFIKFDTGPNWENLSHTIPEKNVIIVYLDDNNFKIPKIKIGDGKAYLVDLPFLGDDSFELINNHINNNEKHITSAERAKWNNKINYNEQIINETLVLNRN